MSKYLVFGREPYQNREQAPNEFWGTVDEEMKASHAGDEEYNHWEWSKEMVQLPKYLLNGESYEMDVLRMYTVEDENGRAKGLRHPEEGSLFAAYMPIKGTEDL